MRGNYKKIQREIKRYLAVLLVLTMLPLSAFPAKAVQVEEIQTEQPASESTQTQSLEQPEAISDDSISQATELEDTKKPEATERLFLMQMYILIQMEQRTERFAKKQIIWETLPSQWKPEPMKWQYLRMDISRKKQQLALKKEN